MRLWHIDLIPYLPKSQLLAQWRELNSIFKKQDKNILINYVYDYPKEYLINYAFAVAVEKRKRGYKSNFDNCRKYFGKEWENKLPKIFIDKFENGNKNYQFYEHNNEYLTICYWNLREKYIRKQKDFTDVVWEKLEEFYKGRVKQ